MAKEKPTSQPSVSGAKKDRAIDLAAKIVSAASANGAAPSDKALRQSCLTALRLMSAMDVVAEAIDAEPELMSITLDQSEAYTRLAEVVAAMPPRKSASQAPQQAPDIAEAPPV